MLPPDKRSLDRGCRGLDRWAWILRLPIPKATQDLGLFGPGLGIVAEQRDTQLVEVGREPGRQLPWRGRVQPLLIHEHHERTAGEGKATRQGLVQNHPDTVPVTRRGDRLPEGLFRGHVSRRPEHMRFCTVMESRRSQFRAEAEVQNHHAAIVRHKHIRWFEIPVQPAARVQRRNTFRQLHEAGPESVEPVRTLKEGGLARPEVPLDLRRGRRVKLGGRLIPRDTMGGAYKSEEVHPVNQVHREEPIGTVRDELVERLRGFDGKCRPESGTLA